MILMEIMRSLLNILNQMVFQDHMRFISYQKVD